MDNSENLGAEKLAPEKLDGRGDSGRVRDCAEFCCFDGDCAGF